MGSLVIQAMTKEKHEAKEQDAKKVQPMAPSGSFIHCDSRSDQSLVLPQGRWPTPDRRRRWAYREQLLVSVYEGGVEIAQGDGYETL